jgi:hypothetical protein
MKKYWKTPNHRTNLKSSQVFESHVISSASNISTFYPPIEGDVPVEKKFSIWSKIHDRLRSLLRKYWISA